MNTLWIWIILSYALVVARTPVVIWIRVLVPLLSETWEIASTFLITSPRTGRVRKFDMTIVRMTLHIVKLGGVPSLEGAQVRVLVLSLGPKRRTLFPFMYHYYSAIMIKVISMIKPIDGTQHWRRVKYEDHLRRWRKSPSCEVTVID